MKFQAGRALCLFVLALTSLGLIIPPFSSAAQNQTNPTAPAVGQTASQPQDYIIGPDDLLDIRVFEQPEMGGKVRVSAQGFIRLPFIGQVKAAGYTESQLVDILREKLLTQLRDPQVSVFVDEHKNQQQVSVIGYVGRPGRYNVSPGMRLLTLFAIVGGVLSNAGNSAMIIRGNSLVADRPEGAENGQVSVGLETVDLRKLMSGDPRFNPLIYPGDVVSVPEAQKVFVTGNVTTPGAFDLRGDLTISQAVALAGGLKPGSRKEKVIVVRQDPNKVEKTELTVNLGQVEKKRVDDLALQANDVIFVPSSMVKNFGMAMLTSFGMQAAIFPLYLIRR